MRISSFSIRFSAGLSKRFTGPRDVVICLRFSMSALFMVRESSMLGRKTVEKVITPMIRFRRLLKASCVWRMYAAVPAKAEQNSIFADDAQSTVKL